MSSDQVSSDSSAPSALIVSDDTGNLDSSWLNANYPSTPPTKQLPLARGLHLSEMVYAVAGGIAPWYRNRKGFVVPGLTDMSNTLLPRFQADTAGNSLGLLVEPTSSNLLTYDRIGFSSGAIPFGCALSGTTRLGVDGVSQIMGFTNTAPLSEHGVGIAQTSTTSGPMSLSGALFSATQRYYVVMFTRSDAQSLQIAVIDTQLLTVTFTAGSGSGWVTQDRLGWVWVNLVLGSFSTAAVGQVAIQCASDASGTLSYANPSTDTWFIDAWQLENTLQPTSTIFANVGGIVARGAESVVSLPAVANPTNWMDALSADGSLILEGQLPMVAPPLGTFYELARLALDNSQYLVVGYDAVFQLGVFLNQGLLVTANVVGSCSLQAGAAYKLGFSYSSATGVPVLSGFAVNGRASLAAGNLNVSLPLGIATTLDLSNSPVPRTFSKITGYAQALLTNQLKYLTAV
jgi:hypothetical protein